MNENHGNVTFEDTWSNDNQNYNFKKKNSEEIDEENAFNKMPKPNFGDDEDE